MPKTDLDETLFNNPVAFMRKFTVVPPNAPKHLQWGKHLTKGAFGDHQAVGSAGQVAYGTLVPSTGYPGGYDLEVEYPTPQNEDKLRSYVPMWFLPWNSEKLVGLQIPPRVPSREGRPLLGHPGANAVTEPARPPLETDPDLFFTAAINGCSVFVTGEPKAPRVYHGGTQLQYGDPMDAVHKWQGLFREIEPHNYYSGTYGEVNKTHYVRSGLSKKPKEMLLTTSNAGTPQAKTRAEFVHDYKTANSSAYKKFLKQHYTSDSGKRNIVVQRILPFGCVFGKRSPDGHWTFYLQENVKLTYTLVKETDNGGIETAALNKVHSRPICLSSIFPTGPGAATMRRQLFKALD
jgi:hypothetical protein